MDLMQRRQDELEFLRAAYSDDELCWQLDADFCASILLSLNCTLAGATIEGRATFTLHIITTADYPENQLRNIECRVDEAKTDRILLKAAYDGLTELTACCREAALSMAGSEAIFAIVSAADAWIRHEWPERAIAMHEPMLVAENKCKKCDSIPSEPSKILGVLMIYSHHIISHKKRVDMRDLASQYNLTGFIKIGWPGIIVVEGEEDNCQAFYDIIRRWAWKYLHVRGELREPLLNGQTIDSSRRFPPMKEIDDLSIVANHCREVGLEALFRSSMKLGGRSNGDEEKEQAKLLDTPYGALIHVDHMNDEKLYQTWLRKTSDQLAVGLRITSCYQNDQGGRPIILVALVGDRNSVNNMLRMWRTSCVDLDSRGKSCLERMMTVLVQGNLERRRSLDQIQWEHLRSDANLTSSKHEVITMMKSIGGARWEEVLQQVIPS